VSVFGNEVQRTIFGSKMEVVSGGWKKLHNGELQNVFPSPNIIRTIKSGKEKWAGHACIM
jgi:hypothetical protein